MSEAQNYRLWTLGRFPDFGWSSIDIRARSKKEEAAITRLLKDGLLETDPKYPRMGRVTEKGRASTLILESAGGLTEALTGRLRYAVPPGTTTRAPVLQQEWTVPDSERPFETKTVWRDVPTVVVEQETGSPSPR